MDADGHRSGGWRERPHGLEWLARYRVKDEEGLLDRSSAPQSIPHRTPEARVAAIAALRRLRMTAAEIAECLGMPLSTVSAVLARIGSASAPDWSRRSSQPV